MPVSASELFTGPWQEIPAFRKEIQKFYDQYVIPKGLGDQYSIAAEKIIPLRKWEPTLRLFKNNLVPIVRELEIAYVPKQMNPGPCIVFPIFNHSDSAQHALVKPLYLWRNREGFEIKYAMLGKYRKEGCPTWFGDTDSVIAAIHQTRSVAIVEGFFDLLACRLLLPGAPMLSTGTKRLGEPHMQWLRILAIKKVFLAFDNEVGRDGKEGAGNLSARLTAKQFNGKNGVTVEAVALPAKDPAECLTNLRSAYALRTLLHNMFPTVSTEVSPPSARHPLLPASRFRPAYGPEDDE